MDIITAVILLVVCVVTIIIIVDYAVDDISAIAILTITIFIDAFDVVLIPLSPTSSFSTTPLQYFKTPPTDGKDVLDNE